MSLKQKRYGGHKAQMRDAVEYAKKLGVSRVTLWRVVNGKTSNPELLARYRAMITLKNAVHHQP